MFKNHYSRFLSYHADTLHFACHSHHYWPDVTREAQIQYWEDSAKWVDKKWSYFYSNILPPLTSSISKHLNLTFRDNIVFAPNTHELVFRLLTSLDWNKPVRILTTDSEFYSFQRQIDRLKEMGNFKIEIVPTEPFNNFEERFISKSQESPFDFIFFSQVFFNSGFQCDYRKIIEALPSKAVICLDGYHGFFACPTDLHAIQEKCFYVAGGYKYAQGGEGCCFLVVPPEQRRRPFFTGWFAELSTLSTKSNEVPYPTTAQQFAGSTMDFSAIYRLKSVVDFFEQKNIKIEDIDVYIKDQMKLFLSELDNINHPVFNRSHLKFQSWEKQGHFLTFELINDVLTQNYVQLLDEKKLEVDSRKNRIRFGFGLYQDAEDIKKAIRILASLPV